MTRRSLGLLEYARNEIDMLGISCWIEAGNSFNAITRFFPVRHRQAGEALVSAAMTSLPPSATTVAPWVKAEADSPLASGGVSCFFAVTAEGRSRSGAWRCALCSSTCSRFAGHLQAARTTGACTIGESTGCGRLRGDRFQAREPTQRTARAAASRLQYLHRAELP